MLNIEQKTNIARPVTPFLNPEIRINPKFEQQILADSDRLRKMIKQTTKQDLITKLGIPYKIDIFEIKSISEYNGSVLITFNNKKYFSKLFNIENDHHDVGGYYLFFPKLNNFEHNRTIFLYNENEEQAKKTIEHEYIHFINRKYNYRKITYKSQIAQNFFFDITDELAAYATEGKLVTQLKYLLPQNFEMQTLISSEDIEIRSAYADWLNLKTKIIILRRLTSNTKHNYSELINILLSKSDFLELINSCDKLIEKYAKPTH